MGEFKETFDQKMLGFYDLWMQNKWGAKLDKFTKQHKLKMIITLLKCSTDVPGSNQLIFKYYSYQIKTTIRKNHSGADIDNV